MADETKKHSKDYLLEYSSKETTSRWLALLINKVVVSVGKISDADKNLIYQALLKENNLTVDVEGGEQDEQGEVEESVEKQTDDSKLVLKKVSHLKGVNALIPNESITFSPATTVVYGLNGTGKSGYFRIINEISGGTRSKDIKNNIHGGDDELKVDIDFLLDDQDQDTFKWQDKSLRDIFPFNKIKVFDADYLPFFLNERENSINVEPLGLNFFQVITDTIDEFKIKLQQSIEKSEAYDLQTLLDNINSGELISVLQKFPLSKEESKNLKEYMIFSEEDKKKLSQLNEEKENLEKNNTTDVIKVLNQEIQESQSLKDHITNLKSDLEKITLNISSNVQNYLEKKSARDNKAKQLEVIKGIPAQGTDEWQEFIESSKKYAEKIDETDFDKDKKCIYCHQSLNDDALRLVSAYVDYLGDKSQSDFKDSEEKINKLDVEINNISIDFSCSEVLAENLSCVVDKEKTYKDILDEILENAKTQRGILTDALENKKKIGKEYKLDLQEVEQYLVGLINKKQKTVKNLLQSDAQKSKKINDLTNDINRLKDRELVSKSKTQIEKHFAVKENVKKVTEINQSISTTAITRLSSKAHDELLTRSIKTSFKEELEALEKDLDVSLEKMSAEKGTVRTRLRILGNDVSDILSDGEQKAVGIALFLAEIDNQDCKDPIVFDDPVTSIDHEIAGLLAKRLLRLSSERQIIIFTHHKLFYDALVYWGNNLKTGTTKTHHICKNYVQNGCNAPGCHIYTYKIDREAKDRTGKIFEAQIESCDYYIKKAEDEMKGDYTASSVSGLLKSAIEYYIDEKLLLKVDLMKNRPNKAAIPWENLKKIESKKDIVEKLEEYWEVLSNRGTHLTANSSQNSLGTEKLNEIILFLKSDI